MCARLFLLPIAAFAPLLFSVACSRSPVEPNAAPTTAPKASPISRASSPTPKIPALQAPTFKLPPEPVFGASSKLGDFTVKAVNRYWAGAGLEAYTLEQAFEKELCTIHETGNSQNVVAEVKGSIPVLVLTGDLLIGGRQDRLVRSSMLLEPGTTVLPVFCAEVSRWTAEDGEYKDTFERDANAPQVDLSIRAAVVQSGTQSAIWKAISQVTGTLDTPDPHGTGSYRLAFDTVKSRRTIDAMVERASKIVCVFTVGFAVYREGELISADLFDSTDLLRRVSNQLFRAYAMTAIYGDVANWQAQETEPAPDPDFPPTPASDVAELPSPHAPPPIELKGNDTLRWECRRHPTSKPVHTGFFRRPPKP